MRAAAIAHSYLKAEIVEPFRDARVNVFRGNILEPTDLPDVAIVFGDDSVVHRVLRALAYTRTPLLVVPAGGSNHFARCLGIAHPADALRAWRRFLDYGDNVRPIDLGTARPLAAPEPDADGGEAEPLDSMTFADGDGRFAPPATPLAPLILRQHLHHAEESAEQRRMIYFTGIAGVGLGSEIGRRMRRMPRWLRRFGGRTLAAIQALAHYQPPTLSLCSYNATGEETRLRGDVLLAAIGNAPQQGNGMKLLPKAQLDDGQLDLCFVPAASRGETLRCLRRIYSGTHLRLPEVRYLRTRQLFLDSEEPVAIHADGEYLCHTPAEIGTAPRALRVLLP